MLCAVNEKPLEIETLSWILGKSISLEVLGFLEFELLLDTQNNDLFLSFRTQNCKTRFIEFISQDYPEISVEQTNQILVFNSELYM